MKDRSHKPPPRQAPKEIKLFERALEHLLELSALIQPDAEPGSAIELEPAFVWNHSNNVAVLGTDFRILINAGSFSAPALLARTMMESALILSAGVTNRNVMREKLDYDLRQNLRRLEHAEKDLGTDLTREKQILLDHLQAIRAGSAHNQAAKLDFLRIARAAKCNSTAAYRSYYYVLSFHVHADWLAFIQTVITPRLPTRALNAAVFACAVAAASLLEFYPHLLNEETGRENLTIWQMLGESHGGRPVDERQD